MQIGWSLSYTPDAAENRSEAGLSHTSALFSSPHPHSLFISPTICKHSYKFNNWRREERKTNRRKKISCQMGNIKTLPLFLCQHRSILTGWKWFMRGNGGGKKPSYIYAGRNVINCPATFKSEHCFHTWLVPRLTYTHTASICCNVCMLVIAWDERTSSAWRTLWILCPPSAEDRAAKGYCNMATHKQPWRRNRLPLNIWIGKWCNMFKINKNH